MALSELGFSGTTDGPESWPEVPAEMTFTTLAEIESCPRRWALGAAHYPEIWEGRGYPSRPHFSAVAGTVVHLALETVTKALVKAGCASVHEPATFAVMKDLGGYTSVVSTCIDRVLERFAENPRAQRFLEFTARTLRAKAPEFRIRTQTILSRVRLPSVAAFQSNVRTAMGRRPLDTGVFPEVELRAKKIQWKGRADLLVLTPSVCGITDFKTGSPDQKHELQIRVYAYLWSRDADLNPMGRRANHLVLAYESAELEVAAPDDEELDALEKSLVARDQVARELASGAPPEARPSPDHCYSCGVRQLCSHYWTPKTQRMMAERAGDVAFTDIEVTITGRHGPSSWDARVEFSCSVPAGTRAVVRTRGGTELRVGARLRVLDAAITVDGEDGRNPAIITLGVLSEVYVCSKT